MPLEVRASRYLGLNPAVYFVQQRAVYINNAHVIFTHVVGSILATVLGPIQFLPKLRAGHLLGIHRWLGCIYLFGVIAGGLSGLYLATLAHGGLPARLGFTVLALLWLYSAWMAFAKIRRKDIAAHRAWFIRNYALTFAAVTLRLWQLTFAVSGVDFDIGYMTVAWLSWIPNLLIAQVLIRRSEKSQVLT